MTRSYRGGPDRDPRERKRELKEGGAGQWKEKLDNLSRYSADAKGAVTPVRIELNKRLVALIIDLFAAFIFSLAINMLNMIPFMNGLVPANLTMILALLARDFFFRGRGIGKNLMGLQVVDVMTGQPCSLIQSIQRNIVVLGPVLLLFLISSILQIVPVPYLTSAVTSLMNFIGTVYTIAVVPYETYRVYSRADGLRLGDQIAGTAVIEAPMDFRDFIARQ